MYRTLPLQVPEQFVQCIESRVKPLRGRTQLVELVGTTLDWKDFFSPLNLQVKGHVQTQNLTRAGLDAIHVFRFVRRSNYHGPVEGCPSGCDDDVLCLGKHYLSSSTCCQVFRFCEAAAFASLRHRPQEAALAALPDSDRREFRRTAKLVTQRPWCMWSAADYLEKLCAECLVRPALDVDWVLHPVRPAMTWPADLEIGDLAAGAKQPNPVTVVPLRRPAQAAAPAAARPQDTEAAPAATRPQDAEAAPAADSEVQVAEAAPVAARSVKKRPAAATDDGSRRDGRQVQLPVDPPQLGCSKCRSSAVGCRTCRVRAGLEQTVSGAWAWPVRGSPDAGASNH